MWLKKHTDLRACEFAHCPDLWHQLRLANVTYVWRWRLCGINPAIVPQASKDGSAKTTLRKVMNYSPKVKQQHPLRQFYATSPLEFENFANFAFESLDWRVRCIYKCSVSFIQLTSGSTDLENPTDPRLFKKFTASHGNPKCHSPFSHPTTCLHPEISQYHFVQMRFNIILPSMPISSKWFISFKFYRYIINVWTYDKEYDVSIEEGTQESFIHF